ncbi:MAG: PilZ domain-containing protein [bacterium]
MKHFKFLLSGKSPPDEIQVLKDFEERKNNLYQVMKDRERITLSMGKKRIVHASSLFLKIVKKDNHYFFIIDSLVPYSRKIILLEDKIALVSYKIDNIACGFMSKLYHHIKTTDTFVMTFPKAVYRLQRRQFFRVNTPLNTDIEITPLNMDKVSELPVFDISEGGISFFALEKHGFEVDEEYTVNIVMKEGHVLKVNLLVRNIITKVHHKKYNQRICCEFKNIDGPTRRIVAKYVFKRQMEEIKRKRDN